MRPSKAGSCVRFWPKVALAARRLTAAILGLADGETQATKSRTRVCFVTHVSAVCPSSGLRPPSPRSKNRGQVDLLPHRTACQKNGAPRQHPMASCYGSAAAFGDCRLFSTAMCDVQCAEYAAAINQTGRYDVIVDAGFQEWAQVDFQPSRGSGRSGL
jgi:hypothetical protein